MAFLATRPGGTNHYRYDFDRDGADEWALENSGLRVIVSPESGGQVIALVDKSTGVSLSSSVGLLRDSFAYTENSPGTSPSRPRGGWGLFNRPYIAEWLSEDASPALELHYDAPDVFPAGATIRKTIQFESADALKVDYRVELRSTSANQTITTRRPQSFIAVNSLPAIAAAEHSTRFCWPLDPTSGSQTETPSGGTSVTSQPNIEETANLHCENFVQAAAAIEVPQDRRSVQVHTPGRPVMAIEWDCEKSCPRMTIEPKNSSALFRLEFPPLAPGAGAAQYTLRIRVLPLAP